MELLSLGRRFEELRAGGATHPDQELGLLACEEALQAARLRNYGVGAVLVDPCGEVIGRGQNEAFFPSFRSGQYWKALCTLIDDAKLGMTCRRKTGSTCSRIHRSP